jgi:hypothetical protein
VVASVRNGGSVLAPGVRVNFYVKDFTVGGSPEAFLGADVRDIPAGGVVEFTTNWVPPGTGHYCVVVRIPLYIDPNVPTIVEMTELNNVAQSNYDRFNTATSSPSSREHTTIAVGNPYDKPTRVWLIGQQSNPLFRTYLEHTWLLLEPGEVRDIGVMLEYALDPKRPDAIPEDAKRFERYFEKYTRIPNNVGLHAYAEDPNDDPRHALELMGGAGLLVTTGRATAIDDLTNEGPVINGTVVTTDDRKGVPDGKVVVTVSANPDAPDSFVVLSGTLDDGQFQVVVPSLQQYPFDARLDAHSRRKFPAGLLEQLKNVAMFRRATPWKVMRVEYLGAPGFAPSTVGWIERL